MAKYCLTGSVLLLALLWRSSCFAQATNDERGITLGDIRQAEVALVNVTAGPGLEGVTQELNQPGRHSDYFRTSFGGSFDFGVKKFRFNGFMGGAILYGNLVEDFDITLSGGEEIVLHTDRQMLGLRASGGLVFPYNAYLKIRPYFSLIVSDLNTQTSLSELSAPVVAELQQDAEYLSAKANAWSSVATVEFDYHRWYEDVRVEALTLFNISNINTFSTDTPEHDQDATSGTFLFKANASRDISRGFWGRPITGRLRYSYTDYIDQPKAALGFTQLHEVGIGADWHIRIRPLDWFGIHAVGVKASYVKGDGVEGYNLGFTLR